MATDRKPYFRVANSVYREPWPYEAKACLCMLSAHLSDRWARDRLSAQEACRAVLSSGTLFDITGKRRLDSARLVLERLATCVSLTIHYRGDFTEIEWPKFAEFQEFESSRRGNPTLRNRNPNPISAPAPAPAHTVCAATPAKPSRKPRQPKREVPEWALQNAELLIELLKPIPGARLPPRAKSTWAAHIARMPAEIPELVSETDPGPKIEAGIRWALGPANLGTEFEVVIRSGKALREKWPQLVDAARRVGQKDPEVKRAKHDDEVNRQIREAQLGRT